MSSSQYENVVGVPVIMTIPNATTRGGPVGPIVLNGSPLFYWAGESGANPMRLAGGSWLTNFAADVGDGRFDGPWAQALSTPWSAMFLKWLHPMRTSRYPLSEKFSPWMHRIAALAPHIRAHRMDVPVDSPPRVLEREVCVNITRAIETLRGARRSRGGSVRTSVRLTKGAARTSKKGRKITVRLLIRQVRFSAVFLHLRN